MDRDHRQVLVPDRRTRGTREVEIFKRKLDLVFLAIHYFLVILAGLGVCYFPDVETHNILRYGSA